MVKSLFHVHEGVDVCAVKLAVQNLLPTTMAEKQNAHCLSGSPTSCGAIKTVSEAMYYYSRIVNSNDFAFKLVVFWKQKCNVMLNDYIHLIEYHDKELDS